MSLRKGSRLPPRVKLLLAAATAVPLVALVWVSWRVLDQDRALEEQQLGQRIERAADIAAAALERTVEASERRLVEGTADWPDGAAVVSVRGDEIEVRPAGRLAYLPVAPRLPELPLAPFAAGELLEFRQRDFTRAAAFYRSLAGSKRPGIRLGALLRLARTLRSSGQPAEALPVYARLLDDDGWTFEGLPASLTARQARCALMDVLGRSEDLRQEAELLVSDLKRGRWPLTRAQAELLEQDLAGWGVPLGSDQTERRLLADGLAALWTNRFQPESAASGREALPVGQEETVVALWNRSTGRVSVLLAAPRFVSTQWLGAIGPVLEEQRIRLTLHSGTRGLPPGIVRRADDTGLPWTVVVNANDPAAERAEYQARRRLLLSVFILLGALIVLAGYLIFRATGREFAAAQLQSDFVAAVSHEFRTPLTSLRQFTDMLRERGDMTDERRNLCMDAQARATARLTRLVESLLDFGRMEGGARIYHPAPLEVNALVRSVVEDYRTEAPSAGFEFRLTGQEPAEVDADAEALGRALWNLLDNAVKYSGESRVIEVGVSRAGPDVRISVKDYGLGIPAHEQAQIFRKFRRGDEAVRLGLKGTGIGLTMVDHIMRAHRGRVEVRSEPGRGSTFILVLPARR